MDNVSEKELEQLKRLEQFGKQIQLILKHQILPLILILILFLGGSTALVYMRATKADNRYTARLALHYYPKQSGKITPYDEKFMLQMFNSPTLRNKFFNALKDKDFDGAYSGRPIMFKVEKKRNDSFMIVLNSNNEKEAIDQTNTFAGLCVREYAERRSGDLKKFESVLQQKKHDVFQQIQEINDKKKELIAQIQVLTPEKDYEQLRAELTEHQTASGKLRLVLKNLKNHEKQLLDKMQAVNPRLLKYQKEIRERISELKALDREINVARELYTEKNPKLISLLSRQNHLQTNFTSFLNSHGITSGDTEQLDTVDNLGAELKTVQDELKDREEELLVLDGEIAEKQKRFETLARILPAYNELTQKAQSLLDSLQKVDESIADVNYQLLLVKDDLFVTEKVESAVEKSPLSKKYVALAVFIAIVLTAFTAVLMAFLEYMFGKIFDEKEMMLFSDLYYLGKLPTSQDLFEAETSKQLIFNAITHRFQHAPGKEYHVVFAGSLPGAKVMQEFYSTLEWNYAMAGRKVLTIDIVSTENAGETQPMKDTSIIVYSGGKAVLPITSRNYILPPEMEMLKLDLTVLRESYDLILFRHPFSFRHDKLFLEELTTVCDGLLIAVGFRKTYRKCLRALDSFRRDTGLPVMTLLTDDVAAHFTKMMNREIK